MSAIIDNNKIILSSPVSGSKIAEINIEPINYIKNLIKDIHHYEKWSTLTLDKRCYYINKFRKKILENSDEIKNILIGETGKKDFDAFIEIFTTLEHLKEITKIAKRHLRREKRSTGILKNKKAYIQYESLGTAGIISPWNYPLVIPITISIDALLAGNNVILKPSEHTPLTSIFIKDLWDKAIGFKKAFTIVNGPGNIGELLVNSKQIDIISFTGSTSVGKKIAKKCASTLKPLILELGGKDPMIILKDADLHRATEAAIFGGFNNAGQACISVEEIFVEKEIFNSFCKKIKRRVVDMSSSNNDRGEIGPIITKENYIKVSEHINEIDSSKIIQGNCSKENMYIPPTIIINPDIDNRVVNEETFGPVISIREFDNDQKMINDIHHTGYGLSASIFGKDKNRISAIVRNIKTGNMSINDVFSHYGIASLPFGGEGFSGLGRLHGKEGLRSFCRVKSIVENKYSFLDDPWWFNKRKSMSKLLNKALDYYKW